MASSVLPATSLGLPASLDYKLPPSLSADSKAYWVSIAPDSLQSVSSAAVPIGTTAVATSQLNAFNSQIVAFTIPTGSSRSVFCDCRETTLNFRLAINITTGTNAAMTFHNLISSSQSFWDSLTLYSNNIPIEQVQSYNILANQLLMATVNSAEKLGGCAVAMGCDVNSATGVDLPPGNTVGITYYNFSIPLISVIGINNPNHMFPVGAISNLQLQMQTAALLPFSSYNTAALTNAGVMTVTLDQFALNLKYIDIGMDSARLLYSTLNEGKIFMKTSTWVQSSANIAASALGQQNLLYQIRNSSLKSLLIQNSCPNAGATNVISPNGSYDALNMGVTSFNVSVGGINFPQRPIDPSRRPAEAFMAYLSALGFSGDFKKYGGYITRSSYGASANITGITNVDSSMVVPAASVRNESSLIANTQPCVSFPSCHFLGIDFERSAGILFSGVNTRSSPPVGNYYIGCTTALPNSVTSYAFGLVDCVLVVDTMSQTIQAFV